MIELRPTAMRATWTAYGEDAADEVRAARNDMLGVLDVVLAGPMSEPWFTVVPK